MAIVTLAYQFRQSFRVPARSAYAWCTDFGPSDGPLFSERTQRAVHYLSDDALVMTDTTYLQGRTRKIRRLVRLVPSELAWTNTHLDGPFRHSQYWYHIRSDGPQRSHLEFRGLRLETTSRPISQSETALRARQRRRSDSEEWRTRLAPALERDLR